MDDGRWWTVELVKSPPTANCRCQAFMMVMVTASMEMEMESGHGSDDGELVMH